MSEIKKPDIYKMNLPADLKKLSTEFLNHLKIKSSGTLVIRHIHIKYLRVDSKSLKLSDRKTVFRVFADLMSQCMMLL